jgi:hypothetical protein
MRLLWPKKFSRNSEAGTRTYFPKSVKVIIFDGVRRFTRSGLYEVCLVGSILGVGNLKEIRLQRNCGYVLCLQYRIDIGILH